MKYSEEEKKEVEELKSLLYTNSITQYGKRKLISLYENLITKQQKEIENLRIKNGKEFARGMETNEKSWRTKIESKIKELEEKVTISQGEELLIIDAKIDMLEELKGE